MPYRACNSMLECVQQYVRVRATVHATALYVYYIHVDSSNVY